MKQNVATVSRKRIEDEKSNRHFRRVVESKMIGRILAQWVLNTSEDGVQYPTFTIDRWVETERGLRKAEPHPEDMRDFGKAWRLIKKWRRHEKRDRRRQVLRKWFPKWIPR